MQILPGACGSLYGWIKAPVLIEAFALHPLPPGCDCLAAYKQIHHANRQDGGGGKYDE